MTKEAKLTAAMRILPEWKGYDEEIRELQKKIDSGQLDSDREADIRGLCEKLSPIFHFI